MDRKPEHWRPLRRLLWLVVAGPGWRSHCLCALLPLMMVAVGVVGGLDAAATLHTTAQLPHAVVTGDADAFVAIVTALLWRFALISFPIR